MLFRNHAANNINSIQQVIGSVITILAIQYGDVWKNSNAKSVVGAIAFAGTVVGQLTFGYLSDKWSRTNSLILSTVILIIFTALTAGSYYKGDTVGMFNILAAWRFFVSDLYHRPHAKSSRLIETVTGRYWHRRRIPGRKCQLRRVDWRTQGRLPEYVVHSLYQQHD